MSRYKTPRHDVCSDGEQESRSSRRLTAPVVLSPCLHVNDAMLSPQVEAWADKHESKLAMVSCRVHFELSHQAMSDSR